MTLVEAGLLSLTSIGIVLGGLGAVLVGVVYWAKPKRHDKR